jgi:hypothetical protein
VKIAKVTLPEGGDFKPYFLENVVQVYPHVDATKTTIEELTWDRGPIELLFIDAPKTFADLSRSLLTFGPDLSVGRSLLILQDFFFTPAYPIALTVACMSESVELVHTVSGSSTAAFVLRSALPTDVPHGWRYWELNDARLVERWQRLLGKLPDDQKSLLDPALAFYYLDRGRVADAKRHMQQINFSEFGRRRIDFLRSTTAWGPRVTTMLEP